MRSFLMGFSAGVGLGMLFAPRSGSDTRRYIAQKTSEGSDYITQHSQDLKDSASDLIDRGRSAVMSSREKLSDTIDSIRGGSHSSSQPSTLSSYSNVGSESTVNS